MKKGRHRRFEEARALKRSSNSGLDVHEIFGEEKPEACAECGAAPGAEHSSWCMAEDLEEDGDWG